MTVCGRIRPPLDPPDEVKVADHEGFTLVTRYERDGVLTFARVAHNLKKNGSAHLHFDFGTKEWFDYREFTPKVNATPEEFMAKLAPFDGLRYDAAVDVLYGLTEESLPPPVANMVSLSRFKSEGMEVELSSGTLQFTGQTVLRSLSWEKGGHPNGYLVTVELCAPVHLGDELFSSALGYSTEFLQLVTPQGERA